MDLTLKCNNVKCRKEVNDLAVVTTCCHIFCINCSNSCQLSGRREGQRPVCPACEMQLMNPDDVVVTNLNPTEDYKTSVLSGLNPNVIMECAGRALNFWAYQAMQEAVYQEFIAKNLTDKYSTLSLQMDKVVNEANGQISHLRSKLSAMQVDQDNLRRKNEELAQVAREKSRKLLQTQELYDKLKRRAMLGQVQNAASDAVDDTIQASSTTDSFANRAGAQNQRSPSHAMLKSQNGGVESLNMGFSNGMNMGPPAITRDGHIDGTWSGIGSQGNQGSFSRNQFVQTPTTHRQRLAPGNAPSPRIGLVNLQPNATSSTPVHHQRTSPSVRQPLSNLHINAPAGSGFAGYGMTAGLKASNPTGTVTNGVERPMMRSRVAHKQGSGFPPIHNSGFGPPAAPNMFSNGDAYY